MNHISRHWRQWVTKVAPPPNVPSRGPTSNTQYATLASPGAARSPRGRFRQASRFLTLAVLATLATQAAAAGSGIDAVVERNYYVGEPAAAVVLEARDAGLSDAARLAASVEGPGGAVKRYDVPVRDGAAELSAPIGDWPAGEYGVRLEVRDGGGAVWEGRDRIVKRPPPPAGVRVVQIDRVRRTLLLDGEPWFPLGVIGAPPESLPEVAGAGFNLTMRWKGVTTADRFDRGKPADHPDNRRAVRDYLDRVHDAGLLALEAPVKLVEESMYLKYRDPAWERKYPVVNREITPAVVRLARDHPAVVGYYSYDEPDDFYPDSPDDPRRLLMREGVEQWYRTVSRLDPYHPVMTLFAADLTKVRDWDAWDVPLRDFYPLPGRPLAETHRVAAISAAVAERRHEPFVFTPLFEKSSGRPLPLSPGEQRAQTYLALTGGAKGLLYWDWPAAYGPNWEMLGRLAGEVNELAPALLTRSPAKSVEYGIAGTEDVVKALVKDHDGGCLLIAVNAEPRPARVRYGLPFPLPGPVGRTFGDPVPAAGATFSDRIEPHGRRVYRLPRPWPAGGRLTLSVRQEDGDETGDETESGSEPDDGDNLLTGGGFERDAPGLPGWPAGWHPADTVMESGVTDAAAGGRWAVLADGGRSGGRALRLIKATPGIADSAGVMERAAAPAACQEVTLPATGTYALSAWLRADRPARVRAMVGWAAPTDLNVGTEWRRFEVTAEREAGGSFVRLYLLSEGALMLDDVSLERAP